MGADMRLEGSLIGWQRSRDPLAPDLIHDLDDDAAIKALILKRGFTESGSRRNAAPIED